MDGILWESRSTLQAIIQASPLAIIAMDREGKITTWNPAAQRMFGWSEKDVLSQPPPYVPEDSQEEFRELRERELGGEVRTGLELHRQRRDGSMIDVSLSTALIHDAAGQIAGILGVLEDITERKRTEAAAAARTRQLEAIRTVTQEITRELDLTTLLTLINRRAAELVGATSGIIRLWDEEAEILIPAAWHGRGDWAAKEFRRLGESVSGVAAARRKGLIVNDYRTSPYAMPTVLERSKITAVLAEPLLYRDRLLGVLAVDRHAPEPPFTEQHQEILALFADQAAIAIENARLYQDVERQRREVEIVDDLSRKLNATLDPDTVLQRVVEGAKELTGSDLAQIALRDDQTDTLEFRHRAGSHSCRLQTHRIERGKGIGGKVMVTGQPFRTPNYTDDPRITKDYLASTLTEGVIAELAVPIQTEGRVEGVLFVDNRSPCPFTEGDERTLLRLADHAAVAIRNARLHVTAVLRAEQLATLSELTQALTAELDPQFLTRRILEAVQVLIPHAAGLLLEQPEGAKTFRVLAHIGLQRSPDRTSFHLPADTGLAGMATETRQPVVSTDIAQDPLFVGRAWAAAEGLVSGIVLPLGYGDRVIGVLSVFLRRPHAFADEEINLLRSFAAQGAVALENARLFEQVRLGRERLLHLTQQVLSAQEEERGRLARELHDEAGQALTALRISLGLIRDDLPPEAALLRQRLGETVNLTESITDQLRLLAQALHPPALKTLGLHKTIEGQCREFSRLTRLPIDYAGTDLPSVPDSVGIHLHRFLQEAITNVSKHAKAHRVRVALEDADGMISLTVEDDGVGFDAPAQLRGTVPNGIGLLGMRERLDLLKGRLEITSQPGQGTRLVARVPWRGAP